MIEKVFKIDGKDFILRDARIADCDFLAEVVMQSEMSGTDKCGLAYLYGLSNEELKTCLVEIFEEEIDGCEFSLSSFLIIEHEGNPIAAMGAWTEGYNESELPSSIIKANLCAYYIPKENILLSKERSSVVSELQIDREEGTMQFEYSYIQPEFQGLFLRDILIETLISREKQLHPELKKAQAHIFLSNKVVILLTKYDGFKEIKRFSSNHPDTVKHFPGDTIVLYEKPI